MRPFLTAVLLVSVMILSLSAIHSAIPVHAVRAPTVSINPSSRPLASAGSTVTYDVNVSNIDPSNPVAGWTIYVESNSSVLNPVSITLGTFLSGAIEQVLCINGFAVVGPGCNIDDGMGIVHSEVYTTGSGNFGNGTLFTISFSSKVSPTCTACYSLVSFPSFPVGDVGVSPVLYDLAGLAMLESPPVGGSYGNIPVLPIAEFTWKPLAPSDGDTVTFNGTSSHDPQGHNIVDYAWTFQQANIPPFYSLPPTPSDNHRICTPLPDFSPFNVSSTCTGSGDFGSRSLLFAGNWTVTLVVRNDQGVLSRSTTHFVYVAPKRVVDLAISNFTASPINNIVPGTIITFKVIVQNLGTIPATGFNVSLSVPGNVYLVRDNNFLSPGSGQSFMFTWNTTGIQPGSYMIHARVPPLVNETNTANNDAYLTVMVTGGDFGIRASPTFVTLPYAGVGSSTIIMTSLNGFSGTVALRAMTIGVVYPIPVNLLTLSPGQVTLPSFSSANATLTFSNLGQALPPGFYSVNVNGTSGSASHSTIVTFDVLPPPPDFQLLLSISPGSNMVVAGGTTTIGVQLTSFSYPYFNGNVTLTDQVSPIVSNGPTLLFSPKQISLTYPGSENPFSQLSISTTALTPPGNYTITIIGTSGTLVHTAQFHLVVLPPPFLALNPSSGSVGTKVTVHGSGFLNPSQGPYSYPVQLEMTFDDQLVGLFYLQGSSFNFTFDVPHAQEGIVHQIHAKELYPSNLDVQAGFLVLPEPIALSVSVSVGTIYFPGDTATIFAMTSLAGRSTTVSSLQVLLIRPNGSNITLNAVLISPGVYKASYAVPATGSIGTYGMIVKAYQVGSVNGSALASFEVEPTWLQSNGRNVIAATSLVGAAGALGVVALAWRNGYFTRRKDEFLIP